MRIAITGGTGFVGRHLTRSLLADGHEVVLVARGVDLRDTSVRQLPNVRFVSASTDDEPRLAEAFADCDAVAHCAGINREVGAQTYQRVHVEGTRNVVAAARQVGVKRIAMLSFLNARLNCGSAYHETKWAAEQLVRESGLPYTILKAGMIYGNGDHMLSHISKVVKWVPLFGSVGMREKSVRPVAVEDVVRILSAALLTPQLEGQTLAVVGPEELGLGAVVKRVGKALRRPVLVLPTPVLALQVMAALSERLLPTPLVTQAQVRMLAEDISTPLPGSSLPPPELQPQTPLSTEQIRRGLGLA